MTERQAMKITAKSILPIIATLALLGGIIAFGRSNQNVAVADAYHARIATMIKAIPEVIGDWHGTDMPLPNEAVALLRPNAVCSRQYVNQKTGDHLVFLLIQCRTARDMLGHYPPVCYKSNGYQMRSGIKQLWQTEELNMEAMEYEFVRALPTKTVRLVVGNALILPDGRFVRDMETVRAMAGDHVKQAFGAAQMQVRLIPQNELTEKQRMAIYEQFLGETRDVILAITTGVKS